MLPGRNGFDQKKMQAMMKQLGIKTEEIPAQRVIIEKSDGKTIIKNPSIQKITIQGQTSWQVAGEEWEEKESFNDEDIKLISQKTGKSEIEAKKALEETGDIAEAIIKLSN